MSRTFDADIYRNLVFALSMKEGTGTVAYDRAKSSLRHTMTLTGTPTWTSGGVGGRLQVLDFNSAHPDYLFCLAATSTDLNFIDASSYTFATWINPDRINVTQTIFSRENAGALTGYHIELTSNVLHIFQYKDASWTRAESQPMLVASVWQLIVATKTSAKARTYLNGVDNVNMSAASPNNMIGPNSSPASDFYVGVNNALANPYDGKLWFPRIWSRALTPEEVFYLFQTERGLFGV